METGKPLPCFAPLTHMLYTYHPGEFSDWLRSTKTFVASEMRRFFGPPQYVRQARILRTATNNQYSRRRDARSVGRRSGRPRPSPLAGTAWQRLRAVHGAGSGGSRFAATWHRPQSVHPSSHGSRYLDTLLMQNSDPSAGVHIMRWEDVDRFISMNRVSPLHTLAVRNQVVNEVR